MNKKLLLTLDCGYCKEPSDGILLGFYKIYQHFGRTYHLFITSDDQNPVGIGEDAIKIWYLGTGELIRVIPANATHCMAINLEQQIITAEFKNYSDYNCINIWDLKNGKLISALNIKYSEIGNMALSLDGQFLAVGESAVLFDWCYRDEEGNCEEDAGFINAVSKFGIFILVNCYILLTNTSTN